MTTAPASRRRQSAPVRDSEVTVAHRRDLAVRGVGKDRIRRAVEAGRWQQPVPGVIVLHSGALTRRERHVAALAWAGPGARLSHTSALVLHRARVSEPFAPVRVAGVRGTYSRPADAGLVEVSVPHGRHLASTGFVVVHQTRRPLGDLVLDGLRTTTAARAAVDVALTADRRRDVDHVIADVLQRGLARVDDLVAEAKAAGPLVGPWLRAALIEAALGVRSVGESDLWVVVRAAGLPEPEWSAPLTTARGTVWLDAYWRQQRLAAEADGAAFHLSADDWQRDLERQNAILGEGVRVLRFAVRRLRTQRTACGTEIWAAYRATLE
jgi:very-short-patch-repair endonuclease